MVYDSGLSRCLSVILLFVLLIYAPAAYPQQFIVKKGDIRGTVYGPETVHPRSTTTVRLIEVHPLANATVRLVETEQSTLTDENGEFRFDNLLAGDYTLNVIAVGYRLLEGGQRRHSEVGRNGRSQNYLAPC